MGSPEFPPPFRDQAGSGSTSGERTWLRWVYRSMLAAWCLLLGILSQLTESWVRIQHPVDKFLHAGSFAVFGFLLALANRQRWRRHNLWMVPMLGLLSGSASELLQTFAPGREVSAGDALADLLGATVAAIAWWAAYTQGQASGSPDLESPWH